tara:strand:+ start:100 stop:339 length:240 start_codon:yes stop_codon:yes gene_type:complete
MAKLEEKELQELQQSIAKPNQIATEIGMRVIAHSEIGELVSSWKDAQKEHQEKMKEIEETHGKGSIDISTGVITPLNEE